MPDDSTRGSLPLTTARVIGKNITIPAELGMFHPETAGYSVHLRSSFQFFRRHGEGRYSARTVMALANDADRVTSQGGIPDVREDLRLPTILLASQPFEFDELTENKKGGPAGILVSYPDGKSILAVHKGCRRKGIGRALVSLSTLLSVEDINRQIFFWVGTRNTVGQQFLLACDFWPNAISGTGAVRYSRSENGEGVE